MSVLAGVVGLVFISSGAMKVTGIPFSLQVRDQLGIAPRLWRIIGALELLGGMAVIVGIAWRPLQVVALTCLAVLMVGAAASRVRVKDHWAWILVDGATLALVVVTVVLALA